MGLGTLINVALIVAGGLAGLLFSSHISDALQEALLKVCGVAVIFTGIAGTLQEMLVASVDSTGSITAVTLSTQGTLMMVASLALGTILGVNLVWPKTFKPANMLPAVVIAVVWAFLSF